MQPFDSLVAKKVLRFRPTSVGREYSLARPLNIKFSAGIINELRAIYAPNREAGGLFELIATESTLTAVKFHEIKNGALNSTSYNPPKKAFDAKIAEIIGRGNLPMAVHTHPTKIGLHSYDSKREIFYLKSSRPDRLIADKNIASGLVMPEAIFVKDERFGTGFGLAIYEGGLFPYAISALSDTQLVLIASSAGLLSLGKLTRNALWLILIWFGIEFIRRPRYDYREDGSLVVTVSY